MSELFLGIAHFEKLSFVSIFHGTFDLSLTVAIPSLNILKIVCLSF